MNLVRHRFLLSAVICLVMIAITGCATTPEPESNPEPVATMDIHRSEIPLTNGLPQEHHHHVIDFARTYYPDHEPVLSVRHAWIGGRQVSLFVYATERGRELLQFEGCVVTGQRAEVITGQAERGQLNAVVQRELRVSVEELLYLASHPD